MTLFILYFGFSKEETKGLIGVWLASVITSSLLTLSFVFTIFRYDWHELSFRAFKRIEQESKNAGCLQLDQIKESTNIEMTHSQLQ